MHQQEVGSSESHKLSNVLLANGVSVYALAFVLKADILSICCKNVETCYTFDNFLETVNASVCRYSMTEYSYMYT